MRKHRIRTTALAATALVAALSLTACQNTDTDAAKASSSAPADGAATTAGPSSDATGPDTSQDSGTAGKESANKGNGSSTGTGSSASGSGGASGTNAGYASGGSGSGDKTGYGQSCGANDISWSTKSESQAGGYILIIAKAKRGITCVLPSGLPTVAFGSDGTEAHPAEQVAGDAITLTGGRTVYAGVNPKTTKDNGGKELDSIIVAVGNDDPNPVSLPVGTITVDKPIVTNWHTSVADVVPFLS
ncbi:DUF4232 domain-containing protein [Streptomyces sp. AK02-01A]|uniref:DUF4232 domain-containing protein n=1 Tax=Streptomyces sp. AK02-01A TaxID=3028648 RepID=UPI0029A546E2|nr:DUF4232 domain-containing protein [Streptomyces sp. AK02-01A]MDX3853280.1 hypothetical protein [Streptomyces sp. AK02-01A]